MVTIFQLQVSMGSLLAGPSCKPCKEENSQKRKRGYIEQEGKEGISEVYKQKVQQQEQHMQLEEQLQQLQEQKMQLEEQQKYELLTQEIFQ